MKIALTLTIAVLIIAGLSSSAATLKAAEGLPARPVISDDFLVQPNRYCTSSGAHSCKCEVLTNSQCEITVGTVAFQHPGCGDPNGPAVVITCTDGINNCAGYICL